MLLGSPSSPTSPPPHLGSTEGQVHGERSDRGLRPLSPLPQHPGSVGGRGSSEGMCGHSRAPTRAGQGQGARAGSRTPGFQPDWVKACLSWGCGKGAEAGLVLRRGPPLPWMTPLRAVPPAHKEVRCGLGPHASRGQTSNPEGRFPSCSAALVPSPAQRLLDWKSVPWGWRVRGSQGEEPVGGQGPRAAGQGLQTQSFRPTTRGLLINAGLQPPP